MKELFNFRNISFLAKYHEQIQIGCFILTAVVFLILFITMFKKRGFFKKFFRFLLAIVVAVAMLVGTNFLNIYTLSMNDVYNRYQRMYDASEVHIIQGRVENFTPASDHKSFTLDGVDFTVYPQGVAKPTEGTNGIILYYTYSAAGTNTTFVSSYTGDTRVLQTYKPEQCVILGNNQHLEIHYIEEDGENRILFIGELND